MTTPSFPEFKPLTIGDRREIHPRLSAYGPQTSELSFTNLFIWRRAHGYRWSVLDDRLVILAEPRGEADEAYVLTPVGRPGRRAVVDRLLDWMAQTGRRPLVHRADETLAGELHGSGLNVTPNRDHFDYLYSRRELAELAGGDYEAKRNHINALLRGHSFEYRPIGPEHLVPAKRLSDEWCRRKRCMDDLDLIDEWEAIRELFNHYEELECRGAVLFLDGKLRAFTVGERLNADTAVVHLEKGDPDYRGVYPLINREFCRQALGDVDFVNREQDLGLPGLRRAKLSYRPLRLVEKFDISPA